MARFHIVTDAVTGQNTEVPYTPEEEAAADAFEAAEAAKPENILQAQIEAEFSAAKLDAWIVQFLAMTPDEAQAFVNNNSATLAALRVNVARLAYAVRVLVRREFNR